MTQLKETKSIQNQDEDIDFQMQFWEEVLKEAQLTTHRQLIDNCRNQICELKKKKQIIELKLPETDYDFQT